MRILLYLLMVYVCVSQSQRLLQLQRGIQAGWLARLCTLALDWCSQKKMNKCRLITNGCNHLPQLQDLQHTRNSQYLLSVGAYFFFADALHIFSAFSDSWILLNADALHAYWWFLKCNSDVFITVTCCVIVQMTLFNPLPTLRYSAPPKREFPFSCTTCSYWRPR